jgi:hypothetical protein
MYFAANLPRVGYIGQISIEGMLIWPKRRVVACFGDFYMVGVVVARSGVVGAREFRRRNVATATEPARRQLLSHGERGARDPVRPSRDRSRARDPVRPSRDRPARPSHTRRTERWRKCKAPFRNAGCKVDCGRAGREAHRRCP